MDKTKCLFLLQKIISTTVRYSFVYLLLVVSEVCWASSLSDTLKLMSTGLGFGYICSCLGGHHLEEGALSIMMG